MRTTLKTRKPKTDKQKQLKRLTDLWSEYIRKRAMYRAHGCERCGAWKQSWKELQAHHFFSRANRTTQWDERNGAGVCGGCHSYVQRNEDANKELFIKLVPAAREREMLYILTNMTTKQAPIDYGAVEISLKEMINQLEGGKE